jgi:hypothetical protein
MAWQEDDMQSHSLVSLFGRTLSSGELLIAAAGLLVIAALLLVFGRRHKLALQRSWVTDEVMLQLARIADALERQASRPMPQIVAPVSKHEEEPAQTKVVEQVHTIPYSMFGREIPQSR